jgi:hypothetical protein
MGGGVGIGGFGFEGGVGFAVGTVAFNANGAQDAGEDSKTDAGDEQQEAAGETSCEVGIEEESDAGVDEDGEDVAQGTTRHDASGK